MTVLDRIEKSRDFWFLLITSVFFFLFRFPSLFEPNWYGDEGIYQVIGLALDRGRMLYSGIWDNKPPLLYLLYALFRGDQFTIRFVSLLFGIAAVIMFFFLAKRLFAPRQKIVYLSTALFAFLFGIPFLEGNIANAENFMLPIILTASYLVLTLSSNRSPHLKYQILNTCYLLPATGFLLGIAFLFKIVAVFDTAALFLFLAITGYTHLNALPNLIKKLLPFMIGFVIPIILTVLFFLSRHALGDFLRASFVQNVDYVGYGNKLIIPQGLLILKLLLLGTLVLFLFFMRKKLGKKLLFVLLWVSFSLFNAFFSQRPYTHYVLVLLPGFCLFCGMIFRKEKLRMPLGIVALILFILIGKNFTFYGKTLTYYPNFIAFLLKQKSVHNYQAFFDASTPNDYELAAFIKAHENPSDGLYIWGNNAQLYALTNTIPPGRYTVTYHVTGYKNGVEETASAIAAGKPKFIIVMPNQGTVPYSLANYAPRMDIDNARIYEKLF